MRVVVEEISKNVQLLRVDDDRVNFFEGLWEIPEGITYNSYLVTTPEGAVILDGWKQNYAAAYIELVESIVDLKDVKYIIVHHMEPDHTGSLELLVKRAGNAKVLAHPLALRMAKGSYPTLASRMKPVKDGEGLEIGGFHLRFLHVPWLHWPETMVTWLEEERVLFTCDVFGGYGALPYVYDEEAEAAGVLDTVLWYAQKYVVTVIGHYRSFILKALDKLQSSGIKPSVIAPGHGIVWRKHVDKILSLYERVARGEPVQRKALVVSITMYGSSDLLGGIAARVLSGKGYRVEYYTLNDVKRHALGDIVAHAIDSEVIVLAGATYEAEVNPLLRQLAELLCEKASVRDRKVVILSPYGWGGVAGKKISDKLSSCGFRVEKLELNFAAPPIVTKAMLEELREKIVQLLGG